MAESVKNPTQGEYISIKQYNNELQKKDAQIIALNRVNKDLEAKNYKQSTDLTKCIEIKDSLQKELSKKDSANSEIKLLKDSANSEIKLLKDSIQTLKDSNDVVLKLVSNDFFVVSSSAIIVALIISVTLIALRKGFTFTKGNTTVSVGRTKTKKKTEG